MWNIKAAVEVNTVIIAETIAQVRAQVKEWKKQGLTVGLVPTMGYLHEGHASLVDKAVSMCDRVVASDFVNPTQFGPNEDLESYPRNFDRDCALLEEHGCSMVFHPSVEEMYASDAATFVEILSDMPKQLCGKTRPIHFRGVCTVVSKLFNIVTPDKAFFGQKDAQQLAKIDYVSAVDAVTMESIHRIDRPVLVAMAVYIGKTRLIDNFLTEDCAK